MDCLFYELPLRSKSWRKFQRFAMLQDDKRNIRAPLQMLSGRKHPQPRKVGRICRDATHKAGHDVVESPDLFLVRRVDENHANHLVFELRLIPADANPSRGMTNKDVRPRQGRLVKKLVQISHIFRNRFFVSCRIALAEPGAIIAANVCEF